jgi:preprotein translocase subunit SecG
MLLTSGIGKHDIRHDGFIHRSTIILSIHWFIIILFIRFGSGDRDSAGIFIRVDWRKS